MTEDPGVPGAGDPPRPGVEPTDGPADGAASTVGPTGPDGLTSMIWLLRRASGQYRATVRRALDRAGFGDLVQRGYWVLDELDRGDRTAAALVSVMGVTKQAVSQLVDQLVGLDYVARLPDPLDGRRTLLRPTARGRAAASTVQEAVAEVERHAAARIGAAEIASLTTSLRRFVGDPEPDGTTASPPRADQPA